MKDSNAIIYGFLLFLDAFIIQPLSGASADEESLWARLEFIITPPHYFLSYNIISAK